MPDGSLRASESALRLALPPRVKAVDEPPKGVQVLSGEVVPRREVGDERRDAAPERLLHEAPGQGLQHGRLRLAGGVKVRAVLVLPQEVTLPVQALHEGEDRGARPP